jgi:hypothetical protein
VIDLLSLPILSLIRISQLIYLAFFPEQGRFAKYQCKWETFHRICKVSMLSREIKHAFWLNLYTSNLSNRSLKFQSPQYLNVLLLLSHQFWIGISLCNLQIQIRQPNPDLKCVTSSNAWCLSPDVCSFRKQNRSCQSERPKALFEKAQTWKGNYPLL